VKHYIRDLHTGEIDAHKLSRRECAFHRKVYSRAASGVCRGVSPFQIVAVGIPPRTC
jgi:hypothetical protein